MYNIKCLSKEEQLEAYRLVESGQWTRKEIADYFDISTDTLRKIVKNFKAEGVVPEANDASYVIEEVPENDEPIIGGHRPEIVWNASSKFISIIEGRVAYNATPSSHANFEEIKANLVAGNLSKAVELINIKKAISKFVDGNVVIEGGSLFYQGIEIRSGLVNRIIDSMEKGEDFKFYLPFLENLLENPSEKAVQRLFDFLVANDIEITEDGHFYAWKVVRKDYLDCYSGTFDNSPGKVVSMPRTRVNDDDTQTCSRGLHVCAKSYIRHFGSSSDKVVKVKVHPRDVVSIPVDYGDAKMRTCRYEVISDVTELFAE